MVNASEGGRTVVVDKLLHITHDLGVSAVRCGSHSGDELGGASMLVPRCCRLRVEDKWNSQ